MILETAACSADASFCNPVKGWIALQAVCQQRFWEFLAIIELCNTRQTVSEVLYTWDSEPTKASSSSQHDFTATSAVKRNIHYYWLLLTNAFPCQTEKGQAQRKKKKKSKTATFQSLLWTLTIGKTSGFWPCDCSSLTWWGRCWSQLFTLITHH